MQRQYHILLVIRNPVGGIRTFIKYVYNNFDHTKYHITIFVPEVEEINVLLNDLKKFDPSCISFAENLSGWKVVLKLIRTVMFGDFELIHSHGFTAGVYSILPACFSRAKHIMTSHDVLSLKQFVGLKGFLKRKILSYCLSKIDAIHSVSYDAQENLFEFLPRLKRFKNKCFVVLNGIEINSFKDSKRRDFRKELELPEDTCLIGFLGRFMSQKGFVYLIDAIEILLKKTNLTQKPVILAFGFGGFIREDKEYINNKNLEKYFLFLPFCPNIGSTLKGLDLVVMPSLWEACGLLAMDVMVAGVPLIGTDCIGLREVLDNTPCVNVPVRNSAALAEAIAREINKPSKEKAEAFIEEAAQRFDVRKQAVELEAVMLKMLRRKHKSL